MAPQEIDRQLIRGMNGFAFRVFSHLSKHNNHRNLLISPLSLTMAIALLHNGADGKTAQELAELLGIDKIEVETANTAYAALRGELERRGHLSIANSLWAQQGVIVKQDFIESSQKFYAAAVANLNFADSNARSVINDWVKHKTKGKIGEIVRSGDLDANTILILLNAIYFKGVWKQKFSPDNTKEASFTISDGKSKVQPMMAQSGVYEYYQSQDFQAIELPYSDGDISAIVFLPDEQSSLSNFLQRLDLPKFQQWRSQLSRMSGDLELPRFKIEYEESLIDALTTLGLKVALSDRANYQKICDGLLTISEIRHKAFMEVNEQGTEAAAVTAVNVQRALIVQKFKMVINRPFFCAILDRKTGVILFMGSIWEPN